MHTLSGRLAVLGTVHHKIGHRLSLSIEAEVVHEGVTKELRIASGTGQIAGRNDEVCVAVVYPDGNTGGLYDVKFLFHYLVPYFFEFSLLFAVVETLGRVCRTYFHVPK